MHNEAIIKYFDQPMKIACDRKCHKAWGINNRPRVQISENEDDYAFLADHEVGIAPVDPGTYEGDHAKPTSPDHFPNKWCVRECERCEASKPGEWMYELEIRRFDARRFNIPSSEITQ